MLLETWVLISRSLMPPAISSIARLFHWGGPSTVVWGVALIVILSLNGVSRAGSPSHVGEEVLKFHPPTTDCNSSAPIITIVGDIFVSTSVEHVLPNTVLGRSAHSVGLVRPTGYLKLFSYAATGSRGAPSHMRSRGYRNSPTGAYAFIRGVSPQGDNTSLYYSQSAEYRPSGDVYRFSSHT